MEYAAKFDKYEGNIQLSDDEIEVAIARVPQKLKDDIDFARDNVRRFAEVQKGTVQDVEYEINPGLIAGQKAIPIAAAGCYVPAGRYRHISSAVMTVTTAKVAGCAHITVSSAPQPGSGLDPAIVYAAHASGADKIMALGGVQGVAAMALAFSDSPRPTSSSAWQPVCGRGKTGALWADWHRHDRRARDSLILAEDADPYIVATDLVSQAEHGYNSPVWLVTDDTALAQV